MKGRHKCLLHLFFTLYIFTPAQLSLVRSSFVKCVEQIDKIFPSTQFFLLSKMKLTTTFASSVYWGMFRQKTECDEDWCCFLNHWCCYKEQQHTFLAFCMDYEAKFTEVKQTRWVKSEFTCSWIYVNSFQTKGRRCEWWTKMVANLNIFKNL